MSAGQVVWDPPVRCVGFDYGGVLDDRRGAVQDVSVPPGYEGWLTLNVGAVARRLDQSLPVDPAAAAVIRSLHRTGLRLLVASNTLAGQSREAQLVAAGVRGLLRAVLHSAELGVAKPSPRFFDAITAASGGCSPAEICYVGNRVHSDVLPAVAAGMRAVLIAPPASTADRSAGQPADGTAGEVPDGVPVIEYVRELPALLARLTAPGDAW
ncbi:HAD family hydrolase [Actinomadura sp. KC216]|uniref:HAD family hydrolase n=1 Tax=Actinomadura sp. KC216 TaxID=2530370 RepID=UPI001404B73B|nr:HAD family hydrolase [Actinomadura sp. KC216]